MIDEGTSICIILFPGAPGGPTFREDVFTRSALPSHLHSGSECFLTALKTRWWRAAREVGPPSAAGRATPPTSPHFLCDAGTPAAACPQRAAESRSVSRWMHRDDGAGRGRAAGVGARRGGRLAAAHPPLLHERRPAPADRGRRDGARPEGGRGGRAQ